MQLRDKVHTQPFQGAKGGLQGASAFRSTLLHTKQAQGGSAPAQHRVSAGSSPQWYGAIEKSFLRRPLLCTIDIVLQ